MKRIALVHDHLNQLGGAERVLRTFCDLYPKAPVYTLIYDAAGTRHVFDGVNIHQSFIAGMPWARRRFRWYLPLMVPATEAYDLSEYDLVLSDSSGLAKGVVTQPGTLHICYCHSPTRYLWSDHNEVIDPLERNRLVSKLSLLYRSYLRVWDRTAADRVDVFIANSKFVADRIKKYYRHDSTIIHPPVDCSRFSIAPTVEGYYLIVSRLRPYKRIDVAIQAFNKLGLPLYIIGNGPEESRLRQMAKPNVRFLGNVPDQDVVRYLSRCRAFINPQVEDFGLTPVEAMACGRPVIAYGVGGVLESVVPGKTGVLFDEQSWEALADAVIHFKPEEYDPVAVRQHALQFDTPHFKQRIQAFIERTWQEFASRR
ncbi:MAG: glycosyltransferase [Patescibacteria group bacterium]